MLRHADGFSGLLHSARISSSGERSGSRFCGNPGDSDQKKANPNPNPKLSELTVI